jgi:hypothetical protein
MGLLGGVFVLGGVSACLLGILGLVVAAFDLNGTAALQSLGLLLGGMVAGAIGTAILE